MVQLSALSTGPLSRDAADAPTAERVAIVIMVEPGFLEWQSILLCVGLHTFCRTPFRIYPYCRGDRVGDLHPFVRDFLSRHTADIQPITPAFNGDYPNGNKVYACAQPRPEENTLFLDTDMLPLRAFDLNFLMRPALAAGVQGRVSTWTNAQKEWEKVYAHADRTHPVAYNAVGDETLAYPYFNAGFFYYSAPGIGQSWLDLSLKVDFDDTIENKRPWLDQITLPAAIAAERASIVFLSNQWNRSCKADVAERNDVKILHYHTLIRIYEYGFDGFADTLLEKAMGITLQDLVSTFHDDDVDIFKPGLQSRLAAGKSGVSGFLRNLMK